MKIAITAKGKGLDDQVDPRFGRCPYFLIVDTDTMAAEAIENPSVALGGGAGIQSAQLMAEHDVIVVLTGNCGPNAHQTLSAAGIQIIVGASGRIRDAVDRFKAGGLSTTHEPNVASHFGMGMGDAPAPSGDPQAVPQPMAPGEDAGMGMGRGMRGGGGGGMGMGGGRGMGRGMRGGGGGGMGMGGGRGMGRGMRGGGGGGMGMGGGRGMGATGGAGGGAAFPSAPAAGDEIDALKAEAQNLEAQLNTINARIGQLGSTAAQRHLVAVVDAGTCLGCGSCEGICPVDAITINTVSVIDGVKCTGCGQCVVQCPQGALTLQKA